MDAEKKPWSMATTLKGAVALGGMGVVSWLGSYLFETLDNLKQTSTTLLEKVERLERDETKWATLAELKNENQQLRVELEIMRQVWSYEYGKQVPSGEPKKTTEVIPPPVEKVDPDRFRQMQQQRYPTKR